MKLSIQYSKTSVRNFPVKTLLSVYKYILSRMDEERPITLTYLTFYFKWWLLSLLKFELHNQRRKPYSYSYVSTSAGTHGGCVYHLWLNICIENTTAMIQCRRASEEIGHYLQLTVHWGIIYVSCSSHLDTTCA